MKNIKYTILVLALLFFSCSKEFLNDCDQESLAFKTITADFTPNINNNIVTFKNNSVNAESYSWEFGDGTTSKVFDPTKPFVYRDTPYSVKLTVSRCGGERQSSISKNIDVKCTTRAPEIETDKRIICAGESTILKLKTNCASGSTVKWSNGALTNTITVNSAGTYTAQCVANCTSVVSNAIEVTVNPKPNQPNITASSFDVCEGSTFSLPNTICNVGTLIWNDGTTGLSKTPNTTSIYSVTCSSNGCVSQSSGAFTLRILPSKATVFTLDGVINPFAQIMTFKGSIDYKANHIVEDHGFIYKTGLTDTPFKIGDEGVTTISLGSRQVSAVYTFNISSKPPAKNISFIAYIKDCSGYKYGTIKKL